MSAPARRVPDAVVERAKAAFPLRTSADGLVALTATVIDDADPQRPVEHRLTFQRAELSIEVRVTATDGEAQVRVDVDPPEFDALKLEVQEAAGGLHTVTAASGSQASWPDDASSIGFVLPLAIVRLHVLGVPGAPRLSTEWFRL